MKYLLVMQQGGGCNDTVACGTKTTILTANNEVDARKEAVDVIDGHGGFWPGKRRALDSAVLHQIVQSIPINLDAIFAEREAIRQREDAERTEKAERAQYERLKEKYEP